MVSYKDITSSGGTAIVPLNFQESVPKYDPSSFYNWEQDNIPLWVLQERGDTLWAQVGYPGGNPEGMTFVLSSAGSFDEAQGIYDNIDDITERIPKRLKFPVLIELCSYGALGTIDLANITCEGDGRLEIRNQTYFEDANASAVSVGNYVTSPVGATPAIDGVRSLAGSSIMLGVSSTRSELVYGDQTSWNDNARIFCMQGPDTDRQANNLSVHIASGASLGTNNNQFAFAPYTSALDQTIPTGDANPVFGSATAEDRPFPGVQPMVEKRDKTLTVGQSTTVGYGNWFSSVNIKDCQGTIIFRNILVDGSNQKADTQTPACIHETENGWNIENSDVIMDNNASIRNVETGFFIKNSRIKATGHWIAWRNYTKEGKTASDRKQDGKGVLAINSDLLWDTTYYTDSRKYLNWFGKSGRGLETRNSTIRGGIYSNIVSSVPNAGSQCNGLDTADAYGTSLLYCSGAGGDMKTSILNAADCNENGFHFEGSDVEFYGRFNGYLNQQNGLKALRSQVRLPQFTFNHNSKFGLNLEGSQLTYGWGIDEIVDEVGSDNFVKVDAYPAVVYTQNSPGVDTPNQAKRIRNRAQFNVDSNNQNVLCDKSSAISPARMNLMNRYYGKWGGADWVATDGGNPYAIGGTGVFSMPATNFGATPYRTNNLPAMVVTNNSNMELLNVNYAISSTDTGKGKIAIASNGSNVYFRGTSGSTTTMNYFPVNTNARQFRSWLSAGVAATDNSNIFMTGPTKSARFGINVLAENNSNFISTPPTIIGTDNVLDVSGYELIDPAGGIDTSGNHTSLELHSTRSCVVINRNSNMRLYGLGGKVISRADGTVAADSVDVLATGYADNFLGDQNNQWSLSTSGGYVKFYPNAFVSGTEFDDGISLGDFNSQTFDAQSRFLLDTRATNPYDRHEGGTTGGMCVRAVGGSNVDVNLVNFQMYCQPGTLSGTFYNREGSGCESIQGERAGYGGSNSETPPPAGPGVEYEQHPGAAAYDGGMMPVGGNESGGSTDDVRSSRQTGLITDNPDTNTIGSVTNSENQGSMYNAVGVGNNNNTLMSNIEQPGSAEVIGDEYFGTAGTNNEGEAVQKTTNRFEMYMSADVGPISYDLLKDYACMGSPIHIWNIADTSRVQASNTLVNGLDPMTASIGTDSAGTDALNFHGPAGKWWNGVALDYFGLGGRRSTYGNLGNNFYNCGIYRLMFSTRGDLKGTYDCSTLSGTYTGPDGYYDNVLSGGGPVDQVNGCGYQYFTQDVRMLGTADMRGITGSNADMPGGVYSMSSTLNVFGWGNPSKDPQAGAAQIQPRIAGFSAVNATSSNVTYDDAWMFSQAAPAFPLPPINMDWQGYMRNWFDETASNTWQNVKHLAEDKVNGVSIYRSHRGSLGGGEGREAGTGEPDGQVGYGAGVRSLNLFDFERLM